MALSYAATFGNMLGTNFHPRSFGSKIFGTGEKSEF